MGNIVLQMLEGGQGKNETECHLHNSTGVTFSGKKFSLLCKRFILTLSFVSTSSLHFSQKITFPHLFLHAAALLLQNLLYPYRTIINLMK
jgi:hypothetical protein